MKTIIRAIDSYNRILCNLLTNETVDVIALISSGRVFCDCWHDNCQSFSYNDISKKIVNESQTFIPYSQQATPIYDEHSTPQSVLLLYQAKHKRSVPVDASGRCSLLL